MSAEASILSVEYDRATRFALALQLPSAGIALLLLDHGQFARVYGLLLAGFWLGAAIIAMRRPFSPTRGDLAYIRWGTIPLLLAAIVARGVLG